MPRLSFGDFLGLDEGGGRGRGRGRGRGGFGMGGRGASGGRGGRGGWGGRGRGGGNGRGRGGSLSANYTAVGLDYGTVNSKKYTRANQYLNAEPNPNEEREPRVTRSKTRGFAPHGTPGASTGNSGAATPITSGLGFHRSKPHIRGIRVDKEGTVYWGGGYAPLFVKAGELFRDGEVDVVKCDGEKLTVDTYPLWDPSAPQMDFLEDTTEVTVDDGHRDVILEAIERAHELHEDHHEEPVLHWNDLVGEDTAQEEAPQMEEEEVGEGDSAVEAVMDQVAREMVIEDMMEEVEEPSVLGVQSPPAVVAITDESPDDELTGVDVVETTIVTEITEVAAPTVPVAEAQMSEVEETPIPHVAVVETSMTVETTDAGSTSIMESTTTSISVAASPDIEGDDDSDDDINCDEFSRMADEALFFVDTGVPSADDALFVVNTEGTSAGDVSKPLYNGPRAKPLGSDRRKPDDQDESIVFRPRTITEPVTTAQPSSSRYPLTNFQLSSVYIEPTTGLNRKGRKAAKVAKKKEKKSRKKRNRGNGPYDAYPRDDSDIDWGSDGPPAKILSVEDPDDIDSLGQSLADANLDMDLGREADVDPDIDLEAMARFGQSTSLGHGGDAMVEMETDSDEWEEKGRPRKFDPSDPWAVAGSGDSDSDDENPDETDDFAALAAAYDSDEDDDDDDDNLFSGHQTWKDAADDSDEYDEEDGDEDWFLQSMESALDGGVMSASRKDRKAIFKSIQNGDFALPTAPAKKSKKAAPAHVPPELHAQWEKDRQKKAEKKQARELERVLGLLGGAKGKKGKKRLGDAAAIAHLIPKSASEVADMFDIDSDDDDGGWKVTPRGMRALKRQHRKLLLPQTLDDVNEEILLFLKDPGRTSLPCSPMDKEGRRKVHMMGECYGLKTKSKGSGASRFTVLIKTEKPRLKDPKRLGRILAGDAIREWHPAKKGKGEKGERGIAFMRDAGSSARAREGDLVGEGAEKIGFDNIGHKLLSMMGYPGELVTLQLEAWCQCQSDRRHPIVTLLTGCDELHRQLHGALIWSEGASIGREGIGGLDVPIVAVVKNTKSGLGA